MFSKRKETVDSANPGSHLRTITEGARSSHLEGLRGSRLGSRALSHSFTVVKHEVQKVTVAQTAGLYPVLRGHILQRPWVSVAGSAAAF